MKILLALTASGCILATTNLFAGVGSAGTGTVGVSAVGSASGGHAGAAPAAHASAATVGTGSHAGTVGGGSRVSGRSMGDAPASFSGSAVGRSSAAISPGAPLRALPAMPTVHNAWSDPVSPRVGQSRSSASVSDDGARDLHPGTNLYPGAYGYVPTAPARGHLHHGSGGFRSAGGDHRYFYNNFPYPVYYPFLYGDFGGIGSFGGDTGVTADNNLADPGAPDFSASPTNYYAYSVPTPGASGQDAAAGAGAALPTPPDVGPSSPSAGAKPGVDPGPDSLVEAVQDELAKRGYFAGKPDSIYSAATKEAIRRFQTDQGLPATGRINEATLHALYLD